MKKKGYFKIRKKWPGPDFLLFQLTGRYYWLWSWTFCKVGTRVSQDKCLVSKTIFA